MRWEDQEVNHATGSQFPELVFASGSLFGRVSQQKGQYLRVDQKMLDEMVQSGTLAKKAAGVRIDRLCLYYRLFCGLGPGGDHYPVLGVVHFWSNSTSHYAILQLSPKNDWFEIMAVTAPAPNTTLEPTADSAVGLPKSVGSAESQSGGGSAFGR